MSGVELLREPFETAGYPPARVARLPRLAPGDLLSLLLPASGGRNGEPPRFYARARYALLAALTGLGAGPGCAVLLPAYHCRTMLDPVIRTGAEPLFYRVGRDLAADHGHIGALLAGRGDIRCLVLPHFFGFPQATAALHGQLERHGVALIEDCAHVLAPGAGMGTSGAHAIFCPAKFLPCPDGGLLLGAPAPAAPLRGRGLRAELRQLARLLALATANPRGRNASGRAPAPAEAALAAVGPSERRSIDTAAVAAGRSRFHDPALESVAASLWSRRLYAHADLAAVRAQRREQYRWWLDAVCGLPGCRPLLPVLPEGVAPYVFPLLLSDPANSFPRLKHAGMPMYRWDELAVPACANAAAFRLQLVQLPCHQGLSAADRMWLRQTLRATLAGNATVEVAA